MYQNNFELTCSKFSLYPSTYLQRVTLESLIRWCVLTLRAICRWFIINDLINKYFCQFDITRIAFDWQKMVFFCWKFIFEMDSCVSSILDFSSPLSATPNDYPSLISWNSYCRWNGPESLVVKVEKVWNFELVRPLRIMYVHRI